MRAYLFLYFTILILSCQRIDKGSEPSLLPYRLGDVAEIQHFVKQYKVTSKGQIISKPSFFESSDTSIFYPSHTFETISLYNHHRKDDQLGSEGVEVVDGYPINRYIVRKGGKVILKSISYKKHNYSGFLKVYDLEGNLLYQSRFKEGSGYWKDYYHKEAVLKEEGEVRKNYKYGKWTYYSKTGEIDSTKHYTFQDSVDVRYPYCFFNKTEPCY